MKTILIIDYSVLMIKYAMEIIGKSDGIYDMIPATTAGEGLRVLRSGEIRVDLILLEYQMPDTDAMAFLKKLLKQKIDLPVIMTAFQMSTEIMEEAGQLGVAGFLNKPYPQERFMRMLKSVLPESGSRG